MPIRRRIQNPDSIESCAPPDQCRSRETGHSSAEVQEDTDGTDSSRWISSNDHIDVGVMATPISVDYKPEHKRTEIGQLSSHCC